MNLQLRSPVLVLLLLAPAACMTTDPVATLPTIPAGTSPQEPATAPQQATPPARNAMPAEQPDRALVPLPSVFDFTRGGGFGAALGVGIEYESAYDGSDEYEVELEPLGAVQYRFGNHMLFWEGIEAGYRGLLTERALLQVGARYEGGREASDSEDGRLDGLDSVDDHIVGMLEFRYGLGDDWRSWVGARLMAGESDFGVLGVLAAGYRFGSAVDGTGTELLGFATFGDSTFLEKDFGITPNEALASGLPAVELDGGYRSVGLNLIHRHNLLEQLQIIVEAGVELYGSEVRKSAIARDNFEAEVGISLVWIF